MRWLLLGLLTIICAVAIGIGTTSAPAPQPMVLTQGSPAHVDRCVECHEEIVESFRQAPHSFTLRPATDTDVIEKFAGRQATLLSDTFRFDVNDGALKFSSSRFPTSLTVDWVFGSGHHALTPVALLQDPHGRMELNQLHVTWFHGDTLGITPGSEELDGAIPSLGIHHDHTQLLACFGCHSSYLPINSGKIDFVRMQAGVSCRRCHFGVSQHVASEGEIPTTSSWRSSSALEAINRCGECHRRSDEFTPDELRPTETRLARFAPVGLSQSRCFQATLPLSASGEQRRLDCTTCHDPHRPVETDPGYYVQRCLNCHSSQPRDAPDCSSQPMNSQCIGCHMPKAKDVEHLSFTDHWIR